MGSVQAWKSAVQQVEQLHKLSDRFEQRMKEGNMQAVAAAANSLHDLCHQNASMFKGLTTLTSSAAECEEVVVKLKVPQQLARACLVDLSDVTNSMVLSPALGFLQVLMVWAGDNGLLPAGPLPAAPSRAALGDSIKQQFKVVGLIQHLVAQMPAVAQQLLAAAPAQAHEQQQPHALAEDSTKSEPAGSLLYLGQTLLNAQDMLGVQAPDSVTAAAAGCELALAMLGCAGRLWHQQQQERVWGHVDAALQHLQALLHTYQGLQGSAAQHALPSVTRTCGVLAVVSQYSNCLKGLPLPAATDAGAASSSGSSRRSGSTPPAAAAAAEAPVGYQGASAEWVWQVASSNLQQLPDVPPALAKCFGLSKLQLACIAAHMLRSNRAVGMSQVLTTWNRVATRSANSQQHQLLLQQGRQQPFKVVEGLAQLELSSMLLEWAGGCDSEQAMRDTYTAVLVATCVLSSFEAQYYQQLPTSALTPQGRLVAAVRLQLMRLLSTWADSTLPVLLKAMAMVLHRAQAEAAAVLTGAGAGLPTDSSGGGSSSSSGDPSGSSSLCVLQSLLSSLNCSVQLLDAVGTDTIVEPDREARNAAEVPGTVAGYAWAPVWDSCAVDVVSVVEGYVRLLLSLDGSKGESGAPLSMRAYLPAVATVCSSAGVLMLLAEQTLARTAHSQALASRRQRDPYLCGFMSLLVSTLKLAGSSTTQGAREGLNFCLAAAGVSATVLQKHMALIGLDAGDAAATPSSSSSGVGSQQADAAEFAGCLPWLVLLGRCCYHVSSHLSVLSEDSGPVMQPAAPGSAPNQTLVWLSWIGDQLRGTSSQLKVLAGTQQLAAAGYALQSVEVQLVVLLRVLGMVQSAFGAVGMLADAAWAGFGQLAQRLREFGVAASSIPVPDFCNNPGCATAHGQSEAELVLGRSCKCGGCRVARYCSRDCQRTQWAQHKPACKALAAAAAAGGGG